MPDFWGVITTTTEGYDPLSSRPTGAVRRRYTKVTGVGIATGKTQAPVVINLTRLAWQAHAACFGMDRELFFDDEDAHAEQLRPVCDSCQVRQACLDYANDNRLVGFWGGKTQDERRRACERESSIARREAKAAKA